MLKHKGFTLVELMIAVAIVGILAAVAMPSYQSYMHKVKRSDGKLSLLDMSDRQERYYLINNTYANTNTELFGVAVQESLKSKYQLTVVNGNALGFLVRAVAKNEQVGDTTACLTLEINHTGAKGTAAAVAGGCWD